MQNILLIATGNSGKASEFRELLVQFDQTAIITLDDLPDVDPPQEVGNTYLANAQLKGRYYWSNFGLSCLSDDSGLEVEALGGAPGVYSARYVARQGATDDDRCEFLLEQLQSLPKPWKAKFVCALVFVNDSGVIREWEGVCEGEIVDAPRGNSGFGYDPIFQLAGTDLTMAQLARGDKNRLSHRARAIHQAMPELRLALGQSN